MSSKGNYKIFPALSTDSIEGWIWANDPAIGENKFITITNSANGKRIRTFKRTIDKNYIRYYNSGTNTKDIDTTELKIVMSDYYRQQLALRKWDTVELQFRDSTFLDNFALNHWNHPNPYISFPNRVTIIAFVLGTLLGFASVVIGLLSLQ